jgi:succinyl-CoA synthetase beta subunit
MLELAAARELFDQYQIPLIVSSICKTWEQVLLAAEKQEFPVVLKLTHSTLVHKTEDKVVRLEINDKLSLKKNYEELLTIAKRKELNGYTFEVQPFIKDKLELIIGVKKDEDKYRELKDGSKYLKSKGFGHFLLFGSGGIYSEVYQDVALSLLPVNHAEAEKLIAMTKAGEVLTGARGQKYYLRGVVDVLVKLSTLIAKNSNIYELDVNPLFVTANAVYANDIKIFAKPA